MSQIPGTNRFSSREGYSLHGLPRQVVHLDVVRGQVTRPFTSQRLVAASVSQSVRARQATAVAVSRSSVIATSKPPG